MGQIVIEVAIFKKKKPALAVYSSVGIVADNPIRILSPMSNISKNGCLQKSPGVHGFDI